MWGKTREVLLFGSANVDQRGIGMGGSLEWAEIIEIAAVGWEVKNLEAGRAVLEKKKKMRL